MHRILTLCCLAALTFTAGARAEAPLERHFHDTDACYARSYSEQHLSDHQLQRVAEITLSYFPHLLGPDNAAGERLIYPDAPEIAVSLSVRLRNRDDTWSTTAFCWPEGDGMACSIECDAGQFNLVDRSADALLITGGSDLYFTDCDGADRKLRRAPDDHDFRLNRLPADQCRPD